MPVAVFCILNSLSQISFISRKGKEGGGRGDCTKKDSLARLFSRTISHDFPMSLHDALFK